ncbi:hypothetical protein G6F57_011397 [Rhizopus arrhizus]|nr:hypothetical protein G6F23_009612 [Rhizopus arrhizus]KAG1408791.1 hypothetical protein G6F58_009440 [Rhizopus delemar]KAG0761198.1 hypothetical protein G6F24_007744 [Rhizopus arrhizus]KAG0777897.1 hypothetical protein G6F22_011564 [Rhizopus arrhizus]KAG0779818.1 hypothetical protein G6F21_012413 [Rhizopus arrhizus]
MYENDSERVKEGRASIIENRTLYPLSSFRHHPYPIDPNTPSPSNSRRTSLTDPVVHLSHRPSHLSFHHSPPSSPSSSRRSSMATSVATPPEGSLITSPYRRESLPSITHLTSNMITELTEDRRHSIAVTESKKSEHLPYSRSPELRLNHKLAERKRRKEMRDLFDQLRNMLPFEKGIKTSKWDILNKALEHIKDLHEKEDLMKQEKMELINQLNSLKTQ